MLEKIEEEETIASFSVLTSGSVKGLGSGQTDLFGLTGAKRSVTERTCTMAFALL